MRMNWTAREVPLIFVFLLAPCGRIAAQAPVHCAQNLFCLFNQEAAASDPAGIRKYSQDLIGLIVFNPAGDDSIRQLTNQLAGRLVSAEQAARTGNGKLVPESAIVKAFNDLMQEIGAPPSVRARLAAVHSFRQHAASIKAFPALLSADRNGTNCNPAEAVFVLSRLISDNGVLYDKNLDTALELMQPRPPGQRGGYGVFRIEGGPDSWRLLSLYPSHHNRSATIALFNRVADTLGF